MAAFAASAATIDSTGTFARLTRRNRRVALLRWLVPAGGLVIALLIGGLIALDALRNQFGIAHLRIDRERMIVDTPELASMLPDGTVLTLSAGAASASLLSTDQIALAAPRLAMTSPNTPTMSAEADSAELDTNSQRLAVPGPTSFSSADGVAGSAENLAADFIARHANSGAVQLSMPDGTSLTADSMDYDHSARVWTFKRVTVSMPYTPGDQP
jgi:lipopolysaccharide export system protein LptC